MKKFLEKLQGLFKKKDLPPPDISFKNEEDEITDEITKETQLPKSIGSYFNFDKFQENIKTKFQKINQAIKERSPSQQWASPSSGKSWTNFKIFAKKTWQNLHWDELILTFLSPQERPRFNSIFILLMIVSFSFLIGKTTGLLLTPESQNKNSRPRMIEDNSVIIPTAHDLLAIKSANLFNAQTDAQDLGGKKKEINSLCLTATTQSPLPVKLLNTIVLQDSVKSVASVQIRNASESLEIREGDKLEAMANIGKIERLRVIFRNLQSGECEYIQNDELKNSTPGSLDQILDAKAGKKLISESKMKGIRNVGDNFFIEKKLRDELLKDISVVLSQSRAIQITNPDGTLAFKMTEIAPGSIYSHLNIMENDIITQINGNKITTYNDLMNMFAKIKQVDRWQLTMERDGSEKVLEYRFE